MDGFQLRLASWLVLSCAAALLPGCRSAEEKLRETVRAVAADSRLSDHDALERMARLVFADDAQTRYDIEALTPEGGANRLLVFGHESAKLNVERRRRSIHVTVYQVTDDSPRQNRPSEMLTVGRERRLEEILYADVYVADVAGENVTVVRPFRVRLDDQGSVQTQDGWEKDDLPRLPPHDMVMTREGTIGLSGEQVEKITPLAE